MPLPSTARRSPVGYAPRMRDSCSSPASSSRMRAAKLVSGLLAPDLFSGWGIRTVSNRERRYNPMSYHNGSVWPHDNALIALGFARYGYKTAIEPVFKGVFAAATYMELRRLPELFCGFQRRRGRGPTLYPVACSPQAWASGALLLMLQASLGLEFDPAQNEIRFRDPRLPSFPQLGVVAKFASRRVQRRRDELIGMRRRSLSRSCAPRGRVASAVVDGLCGIDEPALKRSERNPPSQRFPSRVCIYRGHQMGHR